MGKTISHALFADKPLQCISEIIPIHSNSRGKGQIGFRGCVGRGGLEFRNSEYELRSTIAVCHAIR